MENRKKYLQPPSQQPEKAILSMRRPSEKPKRKKIAVDGRRTDGKVVCCLCDGRRRMMDEEMQPSTAVALSKKRKRGLQRPSVACEMRKQYVLLFILKS